MNNNNNFKKATTYDMVAELNHVQVGEIPPTSNRIDVAASQNFEGQLFSMFPAHEYDLDGNEMTALGIKNSSVSALRNLSQIAQYIRSGDRLKKHTLEYRDLKRLSDEQPDDKCRENAAKEYKSQHFDCIVFAGVLPTGHRSKQDVSALTGYIGLDIDGKDNAGKSVEDFKKAVTSTFGNSVCMMHTTLSNAGVHAIIYHGIHDTERHGDIYTYCEKLLQSKGIVVDPACRDTSRAFFLNHDPEVFYNATPEAWPIPEAVQVNFETSASGAATTTAMATQSPEPMYATPKGSDAFPGTAQEWEEAVFMIGKYCELNLQRFGDRPTWKRALFALYNSFGPRSLVLFEQLSLHSPGYNKENNEKEINNFLKEYPTYTGERLHWVTLRQELHDMGVPYLHGSNAGTANLNNYDDMYWHTPTLNFGAPNPQIIDLIGQSYNTTRFQFTAIAATLTAVSSLLKNARYRNPFSNSCDRLTLNFFVIGEPGAGKNTTLNPLEGLFRWYDGLVKQECEAAHREWELGLADCANKRDKEKYKIDNPEPQEKNFLFGGDFTDASLAVDMHANGGEGLMYTTEGEEILKALKGKFGTESATILRKAWNGEQHHKRRAGKDDFGHRSYNYTSSFSILAGVQISVYLALLGDQNGLSERFQFCSTLLPRERKTEEEKKIPALSADASRKIFDATREIKELVNTINQRQYPLLITFNADQYDTMHGWLDRQEKEFGANVSGYHTHGSEFIYRIAAIRCILSGAYKNNAPEVMASNDDITWAMNLFDQSRAMFKPFLERIKNTGDKQEETFIEDKNQLGLFLTICPERDFFPQDIKKACAQIHVSYDNKLKKAIKSGYIAKRGNSRVFPYYLTQTGLEMRAKFMQEQQNQ